MSQERIEAVKAYQLKVNATGQTEYRKVFNNYEHDKSEVHEDKNNKALISSPSILFLKVMDKFILDKKVDGKGKIVADLDLELLARTTIMPEFFSQKEIDNYGIAYNDGKAMTLTAQEKLAVLNEKYKEIKKVLEVKAYFRLVETEDNKLAKELLEQITKAYNNVYEAVKKIIQNEVYQEANKQDNKAKAQAVNVQNNDKAAKTVLATPAKPAEVIKETSEQRAKRESEARQKEEEAKQKEFANIYTRYAELYNAYPGKYKAFATKHEEFEKLNNKIGDIAKVLPNYIHGQPLYEAVQTGTGIGGQCHLVSRHEEENLKDKNQIKDLDELNKLFFGIRADTRNLKTLEDKISQQTKELEKCLKDKAPEIEKNIKGLLEKLNEERIKLEKENKKMEEEIKVTETISNSFYKESQNNISFISGKPTTAQKDITAAISEATKPSWYQLWVSHEKLQEDHPLTKISKDFFREVDNTLTSLRKKMLAKEPLSDLLKDIKTIKTMLNFYKNAVKVNTNTMQKSEKIVEIFNRYCEDAGALLTKVEKNLNIYNKYQEDIDIINNSFKEMKTRKRRMDNNISALNKQLEDLTKMVPKEEKSSELKENNVQREIHVPSMTSLTT